MAMGSHGRFVLLLVNFAVLTSKNSKDLCAAYLSILEKRDKVGGQTFRVGELSGSPSYEQVRRACAKAAGIKAEPEFGEAQGFEKALDIDIPQFDNSSTINILGWKAKRTGILAEADQVYAEYTKKPAKVVHGTPHPKPVIRGAIPPQSSEPVDKPNAAESVPPQHARPAEPIVMPEVKGVNEKERTLLCFPGQGAQKVGMGKGLDAAFPEVKEMFAKAKDILGYDLLKLCTEGPEDKLNQTLVSQPALFVTSLAGLVKLRKEDPERLKGCVATCGLSLGEYTALAHAGVFSFEDGLRLVKARAEAMQAAAEATRGGMVSVLGTTMTAEKVFELAATAAKNTKSECYVSNVLCLGNTTISGSHEACDEVMKIGKQEAKRCACVFFFSLN